MLIELVIRFVLGGLIVSVFALIGDLLRPKTFAGIFGAAPSVALATLGLTFITHGGSYAGIEGRSMIAGAFAMLVYAVLSGLALIKEKSGTMTITGTACTAWVAVALGLWGAFLR